MSKMRLGSISAAALLLVSVGHAPAADITTKKILIKDNTDPAKRQVLILSKDAGVTFSSADSPNIGGASVHVYGSTTADDFCAILPNGGLWQNVGGIKWKYNDTVQKNTAQIKDGKLLVKIKQDSPVLDYTLADDAPPGQGAVNVQVQFALGTRFCMRCGGTIVKDDGTKFLGKDCAVGTCDPEPTTCDPPNPTTTTSTSSTSSSTSTTSTCPPGPPGSQTELMGALPSTDGSFNYNLTVGLPGANAACNTSFPGTHACTYQELQIAEQACDLTSLTDNAMNPVSSFWRIDSTLPLLSQCFDDVNFDPMDPMQAAHTWEYGTAHTPSRGQKVPLNTVTGLLGAPGPNVQCNISGNSSVGCCL